METAGALIIPGTLVPGGSLKELLYGHFRRMFDCPVYIESIPELGLGDPQLAFYELAEKYFLRFPEKKYYILGHSQGGLLACLLALTYPEQSIKAITFGSPYQGTFLTEPLIFPIRLARQLISLATNGKLHPKMYLPNLVLPIPAAHELTRNSEFLELITELLQSEDREDNPEIISFYSPFDTFVLPTRSSFLEGRGVVNYFAAPDWYYERVKNTLPNGIRHINALAEHLSLIYCRPVLEEVFTIVNSVTRLAPKLSLAKEAV
ncbi:MAG: alpha/beta fold hydrolase [bacterium]|nr:alpha/beta fold hydrolase [bacterium]